MELDFYFPDFNIAIEFNGDQHYFATDLSSDPSQQRKRDGRKKYLCRERGVKLITLKAIDLIAQRLLRKFKRELPLNSKISTRNIDADAKKYRITLKENFNSPTAHKSKGLARQKTVAKLFEKHPPSFDGKWNADKFYFKWNEWKNGKQKCLETVIEFKAANSEHLRKRHVRELDKIAMKWEVGLPKKD